VQVAWVHVVDDVLAVGVHHLHVTVHFLLQEEAGKWPSLCDWGCSLLSPLPRQVRHKEKAMMSNAQGSCGA
jgi:hypothetical protein